MGIKTLTKNFIGFFAEKTKNRALLLREFLGTVAFNNITRIAFGKRFIDDRGNIDDQGKEFRAIVSNGVKLGGSLSIAEHIPWLRWFFPLEEEAFSKHNENRDKLTNAIMDEHTQIRRQTGGAKQHFVDALLTLQPQYDLSDDTVIGLLWVRSSSSLPFSLCHTLSMSLSL